MHAMLPVLSLTAVLMVGASWDLSGVVEGSRSHAKILSALQLNMLPVVCCLVCSADGMGVSWDLPGVVQGGRFNGGALGENLRPMEVDNFYTW